MAVFVQHRGTLATERYPSPALWADYDATLLSLPGQSVHVFEDFVKFPTVAAGSETTVYGGWKGFASTGGSAAVADVVGGALAFTSDAADEGASLGGLNYPFQISRSHKKLWFEARLKVSTIADSAMNFVVGLIDSSTLTNVVPITAAGAIADENFVGWHQVESDGDKASSSYKANGVTAVVVGDDAATLAADTWIKLGMVYDPTDSYKLKFFADGIELADTKTIPTTNGDDFPNDVRLDIIIAHLNGAGLGTLTVDWVRCAQLL